MASQQVLAVCLVSYLDVFEEQRVRADQVESRWSNMDDLIADVGGVRSSTCSIEMRTGSLSVGSGA